MHLMTILKNNEYLKVKVMTTNKYTNIQVNKSGVQLSNNIINKYFLKMYKFISFKILLISLVL